jgi:hypothetical protein
MKKQIFSLQPFEPTKIDLQITGEISRENNILTFRFVLKGDLEKIEFPKTANIPIRKNELWQTTCFEIFVGIENSTRYWEFNISPSGDWNVYRFDNYRQGMQEETKVESLACYIYSESRNLLLGTDAFDLRKLASKDENFKVSITTVVKEKNGNISYWALKHCGEEADFHLRDSFVFAV